MGKKSILGAVCVCIAAVSFNVNASTVFNVPGIQNLSWLELTATANMTRSQVEADMSSGGSLDGWRYATRTEVETLLDSLWGGVTEGWHTSNYEGARTYLDVFGVSDLYAAYNNSGYMPDGYTWWNALFGSEGDGCFDATQMCRAEVVIKDSLYGYDGDSIGWFQDGYGLSYGADLSSNNQISQTTNSAWAYQAYHLVSVSAVPVPSAIWLFGSGLLGLIGLAKRKKV